MKSIFAACQVKRLRSLASPAVPPVHVVLGLLVLTVFMLAGLPALAVPVPGPPGRSRISPSPPWAGVRYGRTSPITPAGVFSAMSGPGIIVCSIRTAGAVPGVAFLRFVDASMRCAKIPRFPHGAIDW
jgi:hypothetical protein